MISFPRKTKRLLTHIYLTADLQIHETITRKLRGEINKFTITFGVFDIAIFVKAIYSMTSFMIFWKTKL